MSLRFALAGDTRFRDAMYQRFHTRNIEGSDWVGHDQIMALDGIAGLRHVATVMGQAMLADPAYWQDDAILHTFNTLYPHTDARTELQRCAPGSKPIAAFLSGIDSIMAQRTPQPVEREPQNDLLQAIRSGCSIPQLQQQAWDRTELVRAAEALAQEHDPQQVVRLLWFFNHAPFPLDASLLFPYARARGTSGAPLQQHRALGALGLLTHDRVRDFALKRMRSSRKPWAYAGLLIHNYRPGDAAILAQLAEQGNFKKTLKFRHPAINGSF